MVTIPTGNSEVEANGVVITLATASQITKNMAPTMVDAGKRTGNSIEYWEKRSYPTGSWARDHGDYHFSTGVLAGGP